MLEEEGSVSAQNTSTPETIFNSLCRDCCMLLGLHGGWEGGAGGEAGKEEGREAVERWETS